MQRLLRQFKNIPISSSVLRTVLPQRASFTHFISNLVDTNQLIRVKRGLYVVSPDVSGVPINSMIIANSLYGPSYVSFSTALNYYGLIDDVSQGTYSASIKQDKRYLTPVGRFEYIAIPASYYALGIKQVVTNDCSFLIATPARSFSNNAKPDSSSSSPPSAKTLHGKMVVIAANKKTIIQCLFFICKSCPVISQTTKVCYYTMYLA